MNADIVSYRVIRLHLLTKQHIEKQKQKQRKRWKKESNLYWKSFKLLVMQLYFFGIGEKWNIAELRNITEFNPERICWRITQLQGCKGRIVEHPVEHVFRIHSYTWICIFMGDLRMERMLTLPEYLKSFFFFLILFYFLREGFISFLNRTQIAGIFCLWKTLHHLFRCWELAMISLKYISLSREELIIGVSAEGVQYRICVLIWREQVRWWKTKILIC